MLSTHLIFFQFFPGARASVNQVYVRYRRPLNRTEQEVASIQITNTSDQEKLIGSWQEDGVSTKVYRKHIDLTQAFLETDGTTIAHEIVNLSKILRIDAVIEVSNEFIPLPKVDITGSTVTDLKVTSTDIESVIDGSPSWTGFSAGHIILEYTRT